MASVVNINDVLEGHVGAGHRVRRPALSERLCPELAGRRAGRSVHRRSVSGSRSPSAALLGPIGNRFRREVKAFAAAHQVPILALKKPDRSRWDDRKLDHVRPYLERAEREGNFGVVAIVACQEFQWIFSARNRATNGKAPSGLSSSASERRVGVYYFYVLDPDFGPGFIKICTYFPYPAKVWVNGHEWAKRQADARRRRVPRALQRVRRLRCSPAGCRRSATASAPSTCRGSSTAGSASIPTPLHRRGPRRRLLVGALDAPSRGQPHARARRPPPRAQLLRSAGRRQHRHRPPRTSRARLRPPLRRPTTPRLRARACSRPAPRSGSTSATSTAASSSTSRTAARCASRPSSTTPATSTSDGAYEHLPELVAKARPVNQRLLMIERAGQSCAIGSALFERIHQPYHQRANEPERCASATHAPWL